MNEQDPSWRNFRTIGPKKYLFRVCEVQLPADIVPTSSFRMEEVVDRFSRVWFPHGEGSQPFWFCARQSQYKTFMNSHCDEFLEFTDALIRSKPNLPDFRRDEWLDSKIVTLAIMMDQVPRNALAIGYGRFACADSRRVSEFIDDGPTIEFAYQILAEVDLSAIHDERVVCFFSLIFRHSNKFQEAREILLSLASHPENLPPLAARFWMETCKRELGNR